MAGKKSKAREMRFSNAKQVAEKHSSTEMSSIILPEGMGMFKVKKGGLRRFDILPYLVNKGSDVKGGNPYVDSGYMHYERTFWTHRIQTANKSRSYACLSMTFGKKCPVCEEVMRAERAGKSELAKQLAVKQRQLFAVIDRDGDPAGEGTEVQLWEYSFHLFGKKLDAKVKNSDEEDGYENFFHPEGGMTLKVEFEEKSMGSNNFYEANNIEMKPRKAVYGPSVLDRVPDLDELIKEVDYKTLEKMLHNGEEEEDEDDAPRNSKPSKKQPVKDDDYEEGIEVGTKVEHEDHGACTVTKNAGGVLTLKDSKGRLHKDVDPDECELVDDDEDDEVKPAGKKSAAKKSAAKASDDDEDEDDEGDEDDDWDDDEDDDEGSDEEDDDEEDEVKPAKKPTRKNK